MLFEEALLLELESIPGLGNRVYPNAAPEGTKPPYLVYRKLNVNFQSCLDGRIFKTEGLYTLAIADDNYTNLQYICMDIIDKLFTFKGRIIGNPTTGLYIEDMKNPQIQEDIYNPDLDLNETQIQFTVNY